MEHKNKLLSYLNRSCFWDKNKVQTFRPKP